MSDEELIAKARLAPGSPGAGECLNELFVRHRQRVALWCLRYAGDRERALDLAQEVFTLVWRHLDSFQGNAKFTTWLYTICRNTCLNAIRSEATEPSAGGDGDFDVMSETGQFADDSYRSVEDKLDRAALLELAKEWMNSTLDETERRVFVMHYVDGTPLDVITRMLGLTNPSGAKAYIVSSRRKLQERARRWKERGTRRD
jgi:RNA polymerase sigma-70 factor (ECF subfamily)